MPQPLLTYSVTPTSVPENAAATLELLATNASGNYVPCEQIVFSLPVGTETGSLTNDPGSISASPVTGTSWSITGDGVGNFTATPTGNVAGLGNNASIAFLLTGVTVGESGGVAGIKIVEQSGSPLEARSPNPLPAVTKTKPGLAITSFTASPVAVCPNAAVMLAWTTTGANDCILSWPGASYAGLPANATGYTVNPEVATLYTLTANGGGQSVEQLIPIAMVSPQIVNFAAEPGDVGAQGGSSTLSWLVVDAETVVIQPGVGSVDPNSGTTVVTPSTPTVYALEATGCGATVSEMSYVDVDRVVVQSFTSSSQILFGDNAELVWVTSGAASASIDQGIGAVPVDGNTIVMPWQTTTYTLSVGGYEPKQAATTIAVVPTITALTMELTAVGAFGLLVEAALTLTWTIAGASGVTINGQSYGADGSVQLQFGPPASWSFAAVGLNTQATTTISVPDIQIGGERMAMVDFVIALQANAGGLNAPGQSMVVTPGGRYVDQWAGELSNTDGDSYGLGGATGPFTFYTGSGGGKLAEWNGFATGGNGETNATVEWSIPLQTRS